MHLTFDGSVQFLFPLGIALSVLTVALFLACIVSLWRRAEFPLVAYGGITLTTRRMRWVWFLVLLGAFGFGVNEDPISVRTSSSGDVEEARATGPTRVVSVDLPLPFYRFQRARHVVAGETLAEESSEAFSVPWPLLSALFAYWVLVLRWNPRNPFARRLLQGRKWRRDLEEQGQGERPNP